MDSVKLSTPIEIMAKIEREDDGEPRFLLELDVVGTDDAPVMVVVTKEEFDRLAVGDNLILSREAA